MTGPDTFAVQEHDHHWVNEKRYAEPYGQLCTTCRKRRPKPATTAQEATT